MRRVIIESPYAGDITRNLQYACAAMRDCLYRGEAPIASHLLYTRSGILDDTIPRERALGIAAGLAWNTVCDAVVVYDDLGISPGMRHSIDLHLMDGILVEYRKIKGWV
jgi:hypothetical protein